MSSFQEYWDAIPPITKVMLSASMFTTTLVSFQMINAGKLIFHPYYIWNSFEIWRLFTNFFFFGKFSFSFLMTMMILARFGSALENDPFRTSAVGGSADYLFAILCIATLLLPIGYFLELPVLSGSLIFGIVYLWSKRNPESPVSVWGFRFTGSTLPWVLMGFTVLTGGSPVPDLCGLVAAHVFYFLAEVLPLKTGKGYLYTPEFVIALAEYNTGEQMQGASAQEATANPVRPARHNWGQGNRLGGN